MAKTKAKAKPETKDPVQAKETKPKSAKSSAKKTKSAAGVKAVSAVQWNDKTDKKDPFRSEAWIDGFKLRIWFSKKSFYWSCTAPNGVDLSEKAIDEGDAKAQAEAAYVRLSSN